MHMNAYLSGLLRRLQQRRALNAMLHLDDHLLRDIGLSRTDIDLMRTGRRGETIAARRA
jgi:uncharacterized protein YjiS (DUF1127 family)